MRGLLMAGPVIAASGAVVVMPAAAERPREAFAMHEEFVDEDPCTGAQHTVTLDWTFYEHGVFVYDPRTDTVRVDRVVLECAGR